MITTLDIVDIGWDRLHGGILSQTITGGVYKHERPINSDKEDVVINSLPINNSQMQSGVFNVNIHVPNLVLNINGNIDTTQPNHERIKQLTALAIVELTDVWLNDYNFDVQQQNVIQDTNDTYSNIRLDFFNINIIN
jgi:hypothetical protein